MLLCGDLLPLRMYRELEEGGGVTAPTYMDMEQCLSCFLFIYSFYFIFYFTSLVQEIDLLYDKTCG